MAADFCFAVVVFRLFFQIVCLFFKNLIFLQWTFIFKHKKSLANVLNWVYKIQVNFQRLKGVLMMAEVREFKKMREIYGSLIFDRKAMKERLPKDIYENLVAAMDGRQKLDSGIADTVALAMKDWAVTNGAS